jgi:hypothetical protein
MPDTTPNTEIAGESATAATEVADTAPDTSPRPGGNSEAAKYRRQLREVEAERDQLKTQLDTSQVTALQGRIDDMNRAEAERLAGTHLADGKDLWLTGTTVADLLDDDGRLSAEKVTAAAQSITTDRPHWSRRHTAAAPSGEVTSRGKIDDAPNRSWSDLLRRDDPKA